MLSGLARVVKPAAGAPEGKLLLFWQRLTHKAHKARMRSAAMQVVAASLDQAELAVYRGMDGGRVV